MKSIIIYATKYGSVEKAAKMLKSKMNSNVTSVNIMKEAVPNLDHYDIVILGGSIYVGKIQKKLTDYIAKHLPLLLNKKVGLFICAAQSEPVRTQELESAFSSELYNHATAKEAFGYEYRFEKLNFLDKLMVRVIAGVKTSQSDLCEEKIENFAKAISSHHPDELSS